MRDPLALDALLVVFGGSVAILTGAVIHADGGSLAVPVALAGVAVTLTAALLARRFASRIDVPDYWRTEPAETLRKRALLALSMIALVFVRLFVLPLLPLDWIFGTAATVAAVGLVHALTRTLSGSTATACGPARDVEPTR
ncbi:hypothetical protein [Haloarcula nitratireducens]|uniref:Uncharacterized protein n=1 Tax=Haloarcula nitratireducens TaxID=2487749 RepID=A0AAW4PDF1_9EURY|nr:hypothetical protein [Halomicroarcula nitratireducens]MBX0296286.1 hypothetical protein [Halomicroarcula nitratireducens]